MLMIEFERGDTMKKFDTYMVNKIFTVPYLDRMISEDSIPDSFFECVRRYVKTDDATIGEAISEIYHFMNYEYRNEYYYKNTILNQLLIKKHDLYNAAALTELPIGNSKADFIMINDRGVVYEIKTDLDNLIRLENQLKDYYKVFSYIYVVVGNKQLPHVKEFLKDQKVGIYELTASGRLICRKKAFYNRDNGTYLFVFLVEKICTSSGIALTYGEFIGQEKYSIFLTMITFLISIPYILSFLLRMIKKFIQVVTGNKSVALIFKPVEALISINVLRYAIYILLFFTSVFTYSVNVSQSDYVFSLVKEALLEFVLLDTVIYSIITNIRDTKKNHKQQNMRRYYVPFKYDLEFVLSAITMHNLKDKEMYARIKFSVDINKILKEKKQNDVSEIDKLLAEISTNYYKIEILEQKIKVVLSRIIDLIG